MLCPIRGRAPPFHVTALNYCLGIAVAELEKWAVPCNPVRRQGAGIRRRGCPGAVAEGYGRQLQIVKLKVY